MHKETSIVTTKRAVAVAPLLFCVPDQDFAEFQQLPSTVRSDVDRLLIEFQSLYELPKIDPALKAFAAKVDFKRGWNFWSLRRKFYLYKDGGKKGERIFERGDWRCLVDYSRCTKEQRGEATDRDVNLPKDFIEYLRGLFQGNKRKSEPALRELYVRWRAGESIPGYGVWQEWFLEHHEHHPLPPECPPDLPRGWSKQNLRRYIPEDADLALAREGIAAARQHLPDVLTTREGLRPLECIMFDDVRTDFKILVQGFAAPVELNLLVALDVATGMVLRYGLRPAVLNDEGRKDHLKLHDMKCLIAGILLQYGLPKNYKTTLVVENATAAIREGTAMALRELSQGRIEVSRTMMVQGTAIWGGYMDKALGNPRGKAPLESLFNLFHNEAGSVKGQIGRRYDAGPMELAGREKENSALARVSKYLTPHDRARLGRPFLTLDQARIVITDIWNRIIRRDDHVMEGFQRFGEWRTADFQAWRPEWELTELSVEDQAQVQWRTPARLETPMERWDRLVDEVGGVNAFQALHVGAVMRLYEEHRKVVIDNSEIAFRFQKETFVYRIANVQHSRRPLQNEMEALAYFDTQDMSVIHLTDGMGGYLGSIPRTRGARRLDKEAVLAQIKEQRREFTKLQERVSKRMPEVPEQHLAELTNNNGVLNEALENHDAINIAPVTQPEQLPSPDVAKDLMRARLAQQVATRQGKDAAAAQAAVPVDCTEDLLARANERDGESDKQPTDDWA